MATNTRDLFNHQSGKGDKPRTKLDENYVRRFKRIKGLGSATGFEKTKQGWRKKY